MQAVAIALGHPLDIQWGQIKKLLMNADRFVDSLKNFDVRNLQGENLHALKSYVEKPDFLP